MRQRRPPLRRPLPGGQGLVVAGIGRPGGTRSCRGRGAAVWRRGCQGSRPPRPRTFSAHSSKASRRSGRTVRATVTVTGSAGGGGASTPNRARSRRGPLTSDCCSLARHPRRHPGCRGTHTFSEQARSPTGTLGRVPEGDTVWLAAQRMNTALAGGDAAPGRVPHPATGHPRPDRRHGARGRAPRQAPADSAHRRPHPAHALGHGRELAHLPARRPVARRPGL